MLCIAMNKEVIVGERWSLLRSFVPNWTCSVNKIANFLSWLFLWMLDFMNLKQPIENASDNSSNCKHDDTNQVVPQVFMELFLEETDFSYPEGYDFLITNIKANQTSASWMIIIINDHCQMVHHEVHERKDNNCHIDYLQIAGLVQENCCQSYGKLDYNSCEDLLRDSDCTEDDDPYPESQCFCEDSDYSDTTSIDEDGCDSSMSEDESDEDISVVFEDCDSAGDSQCHFQFSSNMLIEFQAFDNQPLALKGIQDMSIDKICSKDSFISLGEAIISMRDFDEKEIHKTSPNQDEVNSNNDKVAENTDTKVKAKKSKESKKTVGFAADDILVTIHPMIAWSFAYKAARKGHWENYAVDRAHFQRKIQQCEEIIEPVLRKQYQTYKGNC